MQGVQKKRSINELFSYLFLLQRSFIWAPELSPSCNGYFLVPIKGSSLFLYCIHGQTNVQIPLIKSVCMFQKYLLESPPGSEMLLKYFSRILHVSFSLRSWVHVLFFMITLYNKSQCQLSNRNRNPQVIIIHES